MSPSRLISSVSLLAAASAAGYWLLSPPREISSEPGTTGRPQPPEAARKAGRPTGGSTVNAAVRPADLPAAHGSSAAGQMARPATVPSPQGAAHAAEARSGSRRTPQTSAPPHLSREELTARAARVEQEANHELRRLVTLLDLSPDQQDQIFQTLASRSPYWVPGMATTTAPDPSASGRNQDPEATPGTRGTTQPTADASSQPATSLPATNSSPEESDPLASILPYLTPEQQEALITDEMDRAAWWEEMIPVLLPDEALPPVTSTPDIKEFSGPDTLD